MAKKTFSNSSEPPASKSYVATPIKIGVGQQNIYADVVGPSAALGRDLIDAFQELAGNLRWYVAQIEGFLPQDLYDALEPTFEKSQEYCPVDTGDLKASGYLEMEGFRGGARAEIGYGKFGIPDYAIYVHELPAQHAEPTRDKFLQVAIEEDYYDILQRVTDRVMERTGS